jgi:hypothetical protein
MTENDNQNLPLMDPFHPDNLLTCTALVGIVNMSLIFDADVVDINRWIILSTNKITQQIKELFAVNPIANCGYPRKMDHYEEYRAIHLIMHSQGDSPKKAINDRLLRQKFPDNRFTNISVSIQETINYYGQILQTFNC